MVSQRRDERWLLECVGVDDDLLEPDAEDRARLIEGANSAAVRQRHKAFVCNVGEEHEVRFAAIERGRDVEEGELVDLQLVEDPNRVGRVPDV